jgi:TetR/AcrR family transcriptional regulator, cholesterol catabolism regulator
MLKPADKTEKRRKILDAAKTLFNQTHDFRRVSLEDIATEARISPTTIYNNFGNRENLVCEVIKELVNSYLEAVRTLIHSELSFPRKLIGVISAKMDIVGSANSEILDKLISQDEKITPFIDGLMETELRPLWKTLLAEGKAQGYVDPTINDEALYIYMKVFAAGFRARPEAFGGYRENIDFIAQLTHLLFYGFLIKDIDLFRKEQK